MKTFKSLYISVLAMMIATGTASAKKLSSRDAESMKKQMWEQYTATINTDSFRLPDPVALQLADTSSVVLPENLEKNATMLFRYGFKGDTTSIGKLPLFIYLHGSGPSDREWANGLKLALSWDDAPSLYFIPRIPNEGEWYRWWHKSKQWAWENVLRQALASPLVDPDRIYFVGISEGGYGSQRLASFYADYLAAAGPMAGGEPLINAPVENCRNIAFSLRTGNDDHGFYRDYLTRITAASFDSIAALPGNSGDYRHWIELIPDHGHFIDYAPTPKWLSQFTRNSEPARFTWEDFEMDGRHRNGFYNLVIDQRPDPDRRTRYDASFDRATNTIDLTIDNIDYTTVETDPKWGIALKFDRTYTPAESGQITLLLDDNLVDLNKKVTVRINGKKRFGGKIDRTKEAIARSIEAFGDPRRLFTAMLTLPIGE